MPAFDTTLEPFGIPACFGCFVLLAFVLFRFARGVLGCIAAATAARAALGWRAGALAGRHERRPFGLRALDGFVLGEEAPGATLVCIEAACLDFGEDGACRPSERAGPAGTQICLELLTIFSARSRTCLYFGSSFACTSR